MKKNERVLKITLISVSVIFFVIIGILWANGAFKSRTQLEKLMHDRVNTAQFKQAKEQGIKHMVVCYDSLEKDGYIMIKGMFINTGKVYPLFETLVVYTNKVDFQKQDKKQPLLKVLNNENGREYILDLNKQVCKVYNVNDESLLKL